MGLQILQDNNGRQTGVYVPMEDWMLMKRDYPDIGDLTLELPQWEKDLIDTRLMAMEQNPNRIKNGDELLRELKRKL